MRRLYQACLGFAILLCVVTPVHAGQWFQFSATNPATNAVLKNTGALSAQQFTLWLYVNTTVGVTIAVEHLDATNTAIASDSVNITFTSATPAPWVSDPLTFNIADGESIRLRVVSGVTGTMSGAIRVNGDFCLANLGCQH